MVGPTNVVVIGGGIAGASISRVLARSGVKTTLLEKSGQLCSGATWHAAGLVTRFAGSSKLKKIHVQSLSMLNDLQSKYDIGLHTPGSIRIIEKNNLARLLEAKQHLAMAGLFDEEGLGSRLINCDEIKELHPLVDTNLVECGLYTPLDGDIDPTSLTNCVAKEAKDYGASIKFKQEVFKIDVNGPNDFIVHVNNRNHTDGSTTQEAIQCDTVVNAAGLWSRHITDMIPQKYGMVHPAFVIEHHYVISEAIQQIKELKANKHNNGKGLPVLRDMKGSAYIRQEGDGFLIGPYETECKVRTDLPRGPPQDFEMELFPDQLDRIEDNIMMGIDLVPTLGEVGFKSVVNGPTIWTGDSLARCGRSQLPGWYDFNSLTYGIAQSLPLAEYLGFIMMNNEQPWDATDYFDPLRYGSWANDDYTVAKVKETYSHNNCIVYNYENRSGGIEHVTQTYPLHKIYKEQGALYGSFGGSGTEAPFCFAPKGSVSSSISNNKNNNDDGVHNQKMFSNYSWIPLVEQEVDHIANHVGFAYLSFSKISIKGKDAKSFIEDVTSAALPLYPKNIDSDVSSKLAMNDMSCKLTYACTPLGKVQTEFSICRKNKQGDEWYLVGGRDYARQDTLWLQQNRKGKDVEIVDKTNDMCVLHLVGPKSGNLLGAIEPRIEGLKFLRAREINDFAGLEGVDVTIIRISFTGEMGYEVHINSQDGPIIHKAIVEHPASRVDNENLKLVGGAAINSFRIERGFKLRPDLDYVNYNEAGIDMFLAKKRDFMGKAALNNKLPKKKNVMFQVETSQEWKYSIIGDSPIKRRDNNEIVGYSTTSTCGARSKKTIALGYVKCNEKGECIADSNSELYIDTFGFNWPVKILQGPLFGVNRDVWNSSSSSSSGIEDVCY